MLEFILNVLIQKKMDISEKDYIETLEALVCFYASVYENCKETYQDKYLKITDIRNPSRRDLTSDEENILFEFPQIQGTPNIFATEKLSKFKLNKRVTLTKVVEIITEKYGRI